MVEYLVQNGQQVFVISWRNPDARYAGWGLDTYVRAVLDALDGVERICGTGRTAVTGSAPAASSRPSRPPTWPPPASRTGSPASRC
jgi:polyhydroxyalkanoate synthase